jgi:hypothetical protein
MALLREGIEPLRDRERTHKERSVPLEVYVNEVEFGLRGRL